MLLSARKLHHNLKGGLPGINKSIIITEYLIRSPADAGFSYKYYRLSGFTLLGLSLPLMIVAALLEIASMILAIFTVSRVSTWSVTL